MRPEPPFRLAPIRGPLDRTGREQDGTVMDADRYNGPPRPHRRLRPACWWLLAATGTSAVGDGLVFVALPLLAVTLTSRPILIAGVAVAGKLPWLVVSLPAGALADRVDRRRLAVTVEVLRAVVLLLLNGFIAFFFGCCASIS